MTTSQKNNPPRRSPRALCHAALALLAAMWVTLAPSKANAQEADTAACCVLRPVASVFMADFGHASLLDTYLTPIRYSGWNTRLAYERLQAMKFSPEHWVSQLEFGADYSHVTNPGGNHTMHALMVDASWHMLHKWRNAFSVPALQLMAGAGTGLRGGAIYNANNANNVVSVKIRWSVDASLAAVWNTRLGNTPLTLRYQATLPVAGVFYSPEYDESYFEIYVGHHSGLTHFGWWGNRFDMTNFASADFHLGSTVLRIGFRNRIETSWIKNLNTQIFTNSFVIGVGGDIFSIGSRKPSAGHTKIISSIY